MAKELEVFEVVVGENEDFRYDMISLVDKPAIMVDWHAFKAQENKTHFFADADKQILAGPFMIPDLPIYRIDQETGREYAVKFSKEVVEKLHYNFSKANTNNAINIMRTDSKAEAFVIESWIIDDDKYDKSKKYGFDLPIGTSFGLVKIESKEFWDKEIKSGNLRGFSIEAMLQMSDKAVDKIKLKNQKFMEYTLKDGTKIKVPQDIAAGSDIMVVQEDGSEVPAPDGEHMLEDGRVILVSGGKITEIKEEMVQDPSNTDAPATPAATPPTQAAPNEEVTKYIDQKLADFKAEVTKTFSEICKKCLIGKLVRRKWPVKDENAELKAQFQKFASIPGVQSMLLKDDMKNDNSRNPNAKPDVKEMVENLGHYQKNLTNNKKWQ